ncbi:MAG: metallophosphoesterase [Desulfobaccales bacterium]
MPAFPPAGGHSLIIPGVRFATLRLGLLTAAVLSQIYLFLRLWLAVSGWRRSAAWKSWFIGAAGAAIAFLFVMNGYILLRPIPWVDPPAAIEVTVFYPAAVWGLGSIFSALLLLLVDLLVGLRRGAARLGRGPATRGNAIAVNPARRRFLKAGVGALIAAPLVISGYGATYGANAYEVSELSLPFGRSLRVVQLSDIHAGIFMTRGEIRRIVDQVAALSPDLFLLTGDYISNSMKFLPDCVEEMARIQARYGAFAVMGNHEHWYGEPGEVMAIFRQHRINFLLNAHQVIEGDQGPFAVAGIDDLRSGHPSLAGALHGLDGATPAILLSHHPEIFPEAAGQGIPLTLAGHYHGGQIKLSLPGVDLSLAHLMTPYPEGLYHLKGCRLYVNRGIGTTFTPVRLNARPEITVFHLT